MMIKTEILKTTYAKLIKPVFFKTDPEVIHDRITNISDEIQKYESINNLVKPIFEYKDKCLTQAVDNITFENPVGLAAGFDYDGKFAKQANNLGFGFNTVGTVTAKPYKGNPKPRLLRLPLSKSILVNKGFKSSGMDIVLEKLDHLNIQKNHVLGLSIGSSNIERIDTLAKAIDDYIYSFNKAKDKNYIKYFELNISCPNTRLKENFGEKDNLELLLKEISSIKIQKPIFIKLANEISTEKLDDQLRLAIKYGIKGTILSNLVKDRNNPHLNQDEIASIENYKGNFSGRPTKENSLRLIKHAYNNYKNDLVIIGCGGIFDAYDAYERIKSGASLVQLITGMIYEGPQLALEINEGLAKLLKKDGFENISQTIGYDTQD